MAVFRVDKSRDYTVLSNHIFKDRTLSAKAKGLLAEMLSLPDDWDYTLKGLTFLFSDGIDSVRQGIRELEEHGYVVRQRRRDEKGRLCDMEYVIYETPHITVSDDSAPPACACPAPDVPVLENPTQAEPVQETPTQLNTNPSSKNESITYPSNPNQSFPEPADVMGYDAAREIVMDNIEYDILCERYPRERLDEIVDIASEALCTRRSSFSLGKDTYPYSLVRDRILRLNASHVEYIIDCINANTTEIHQIKPYLLKTLINAPATIASYYTAKVNHDLAN
ncbi:MAG: helix-turn-helix domain-containing protein [Clostridia bacterium]|nr:helix-turn-helix domain-containing protein [Clostridia bacterium]